MAVNRLNVGATNQLLAKASSGQSTNILELQGTAGTTLAGVDASGNPVGTLAHPPTFKNLIINGAMQVAQRGTSTTGITGEAGYITVDRWRQDVYTMGTWTSTVENDAPTGSGFRKSLKMLCTTADASLSAADGLIIQQKLEGQNLQQIKKGTSSAQQLTASFWIKSNVTGTFIAELYDYDNTRSVSASYSVSSSGTWEKKTITFPADTTGAFDNDNATSLSLNFWLGAGSNSSSGTLQTAWGAVTSANRAVGQTNVAAATNNYWQITGVQLEVGSVATDYEFKPIDVELAQCQRYYYRNNANDAYAAFGIGNSVSTTGASIYVSIPVTMRAYPTAIDYSSLQVGDGVNAGNVSALTFSNQGSRNIIHLSATTTGLTQYRFVGLQSANSTSGYLGLSAEL